MKPQQQLLHSVCDEGRCSIVVSGPSETFEMLMTVDRTVCLHHFLMEMFRCWRIFSYVLCQLRAGLFKRPIISELLLCLNITTEKICHISKNSFLPSHLFMIACAPCLWCDSVHRATAVYKILHFILRLLFI